MTSAGASHQGAMDTSDWLNMRLSDYFMTINEPTWAAGE